MRRNEMLERLQLWKASITVSIRERAARLQSISAENFLARRFGHLLSDFKNLFILANRSRPGAVNRNLNCGLFLVRSPALALGRLVLVFRDAGARDWSRSGGHSVDGRSVYLFADRRNFCDVGLERR